MDKTDLKRKLIDLRSKLRRDAPDIYYKNRYGNYSSKSQTICSDDAIDMMVKNPPSKIQDFKNIPSIGDVFIKDYAELFFKIIEEYLNHTSNLSTKSKSIDKALKLLENRLVNINRRNKLLYSGKLYNKSGIDLFDNRPLKMNELISFLSSDNGSKAYKVCDVNNSLFDDGDPDNKYHKFNQLLRELSKDFRETGQLNSYIAYPYVIGKLQGEDFNIRAPLLLFPIIIEKTPYSIYLKKDVEKDILWNTHLVLTHNKFNKINQDISNNIFDFNNLVSINEIINFYEEKGLKIVDRNKPFSKYLEYKSNDFPSFKQGELFILNNAVVGQFSFYSSYLQRDFKEIINADQLNELLTDLLEDNEVLYGSRTAESKELEESFVNLKEADISYINELNVSQEQAIIAINKLNKLVVQGPPGTGKSQTITSIIADFAIKGHNVLMISQKKAALDVIYSRLGELSIHTLMIHDVKDKEFFYKQLIAKRDKEYTNQNEGIDVHSEQIQKIIDKLENIAKILYSKDNQHSMCTIYQNNLNNVFIKRKYNYHDYKYAFENFMITNYSFLVSRFDKFKQDNILSKIEKYFDLINRYPWLDSVKSSLSDLDIEELYMRCKTDYEIHNSNGMTFLSRWLSKRKLVSSIKKVVAEHFSIRFDVQRIYNSYNAFLESIHLLNEFSILKQYFKNLSQEDKELLSKIFKVSLDKNEKFRKTLFIYYDFCVFRIIDQFESNHRELINDIENYQDFVQQVHFLVDKKKKLTRNRIEQILMQSYRSSVSSSKLSNEYHRLLEKTKGRWNVSRFLQKFSYELFSGVKVWLMTPEAVSEIMPLKPGLFDLLIFDEASQLYIEKAIPSLYRAKKVLIAGDHNQLRPSSLGVGRIDYDEDANDEDNLDTFAALEEDSLLDLARFKFKEHMLNYHYRSLYEELIAFSNYAFYQGKLYISPNATKPDKPPIEVIKVDNGMWNKRKNIEEALKVLELIKALFFDDNRTETIGVITFNSDQRDLILDLIDLESRKNSEFDFILKSEIERTTQGEDVGFFVKNIENVQGDERDIIIFSTAYGKDEKGRFVRNFGWLNQIGGENRLNVAISRAKKKIYLVTSIEPNELFVEDLQNNGPKLFRKYLEYAYAISNSDHEQAKIILMSLNDAPSNSSKISFDSDFENEVYDNLTSLGYTVETQIGIGGYRIDLAIVDPITKSYVMGIECDGRLYHSSKIARERDIYRQKYLESRGWYIHRIWSTKWWHNAKLEIEKIVDLYEVRSKKISIMTEIKDDMHIINLFRKRLSQGNISFIDNISKLSFKIDNEIITIKNSGEMTSSYNDVRDYKILLKEIDVVVAKHKKQSITEMQKLEASLNVDNSISDSKKEKLYTLKKGEIKCTCGYAFFEHLGECPRCGENTVSILRKQNNS